ncbi:MAG: right-handed parallel beta-helix repeat-containing protein [Gemmatimonadetes bacterium]|nr:right-handed parallel beta-helix repeat-containing protein [Gemmatimonadota bacterium]
MSVSTTPVESVRVRPVSGCGTLESPWAGWEDQVDSPTARREGQTLEFGSGFWALSRPVRLRTGATLTSAAGSDGRPWFLPAANCRGMDTLFKIDGAHDVTLLNVCLNGRDKTTRHGLVVRCGTHVQVKACRFGDFRDDEGAAILLCGESEDRPVREIVVQDCKFLNGFHGIRLERDLSDLLIHGNRFEEIEGPALRIDPKDRWADFGLIAVQNRIIRNNAANRGSYLTILPGAEGIRLADNSFEGPEGRRGEPCTAVEIRGGGPMSRRRLELVNNRISCVPGAAVHARQCGPGFLAAGNHAISCGGDEHAVLHFEACHGIVVEDNEVREPSSVGILARDCARARLNGNDVEGSCDGLAPRGGTSGVAVTGDGSVRVRVTDNRAHGLRESGIRVEGGRGTRVVGNEIQDCGAGIRVQKTRRVVLVGNDCRDNGDGGILLEPDTARGYVALNYAILNGPCDLVVRGQGVRVHDNKVDRESREA